MSLNDPLANALSNILNSEKAGKEICVIKPVSKLIKQVFDLMNEKLYIGTYEEIEDKKGNSLKLNLLHKINKCGSIKPRYAIKAEEIEKWEKRYLPAKDFGMIIMSTQQGIMTHKEAKKKNLGGRLISYCY
ncbi:MAG: 30S ribosomal protein S8 [Minisyncoccales bacterium]